MMLYRLSVKLNWVVVLSPSLLIRGLMASVRHVVVVVSLVSFHGKLGKTSVTFSCSNEAIFPALG
jgi:hypothetical protein